MEEAGAGLIAGKSLVVGGYADLPPNAAVAFVVRHHGHVKSD